MSSPRTRAVAVAVLAVVGFGTALATDLVHGRLAADASYTSFCNVSAGVNCDVVLGSSYASLLGVSVSRWAMLYFALVVTAAVAVAVSGSARRRQTLGTIIFALAIWGVLFAAYMAVIAFAVLHTVCLLCSTLYVVNIGLVVAAWRLRGGVRLAGRLEQQRRAVQERRLMLAAAAAVVVLVVAGIWEAFGRGRDLPDAAAIARERPEFYRWYLEQPTVSVPTDSASSFGNAAGAVTIVEFSDFECGHCAKFHDSLEDVLRRGIADVRVVFRHFPLDSACNPNVPARRHRYACLAAAAAECAGHQGKFREYHNLLFKNQGQLDREFLVAYAAQLGLDQQAFAACLSSDAARDRVQRDAEAGGRLGIDSTPTVFINGRRIKGALEPARLLDAIVLARSGH